MDYPFALRSPFSTPQREGSVTTLTNFGTNNTSDSGMMSSSPYIPSMQAAGMGSPAMSTASENLARSLHRGKVPASIYGGVMNTPTPTRFYRSISRIGGPQGTGNAPSSLFEPGDLPHNFSISAPMHGLD